MKKLVTTKNKIALLVISLLIIGIMASGITIAYLQDQTEALTNTFAPSSIHTQIEEVVDTTLGKAPRVVNVDTADALVRVRLSISNVDLFKQYFGLEGIDTNYNESIWKCEDSNNKYNTYYYYQKVLVGDDNLNDDVKSQTEALFTRILKKVPDGYTQFEYVNDNGKTVIANQDDVEILNHLNDIEISVYEESIPAQAVINGKEYNAINNDGSINQDVANQLWNYYDTLN